MSVIVVHPSLNRAGGAEKVCLTVIRALVRGGYRVKLATIEKTDWRLLEQRFGQLCRPSEELYLLRTMPAKRSSQAVFTASFFMVLLLHLKARKGDNLLFNTYGDLIDSVADISYINALPVRSSYKYSESQFSSSLVLRSATQVYSLFLKAFDMFSSSSVLLANSGFTRSIIRKSLRRDSIVVYPPVDLGEFRQAAGKSDRKDLVVSVSRIRPGKHLEVVPKLANEVKNAKFVIVGLADPASQETIRRLEQTINAYKVSERVELLFNQPPRNLVEILASSKVFFHAEHLEGFGIAIVEAMCAGCVPIVPRNGGPWFDILEQKEGKCGFSYSNLGEAAKKIALVIDTEGLRREVAARAKKRAEAFDNIVFEHKIQQIVKSAYLQEPSYD